MTMNERCHAAHAQTDFGRHRGDRRKEGDGLEPGLREQAVSNPNRIEDASGVSLLRHANKVARFKSADDDTAVSKRKPE
jgi:hypothetical protein